MLETDKLNRENINWKIDTLNNTSKGLNLIETHTHANILLKLQKKDILK